MGYDCGAHRGHCESPCSADRYRLPTSESLAFMEICAVRGHARLRTRSHPPVLRSSAMKPAGLYLAADTAAFTRSCRPSAVRILRMVSNAGARSPDRAL